MVITNYHARILKLGEIQEKNGFKKCHALIETKEKKDEFGEAIYQPEKFEVEVAIKDDKTHTELKALANEYFPATFNLRSFIYKEKDQDKLGKQMQLKRWTL